MCRERLHRLCELYWGEGEKTMIEVRFISIGGQWSRDAFVTGTFLSVFKRLRSPANPIESSCICFLPCSTAQYTYLIIWFGTGRSAFLLKRASRFVRKLESSPEGRDPSFILLLAVTFCWIFVNSPALCIAQPDKVVYCLKSFLLESRYLKWVCYTNPAPDNMK